MTISNQTVKNVYVGDGATLVFAYTFKIFEDADLEVTIQDTSVSPQTEILLVLGADYTVSGAGNPTGGNVTLLLTGQLSTAPVATDNITIKSNLPLTQLTDYVENDPFPAESHEEALDRVVRLVQQNKEITDRSIKIPSNVSGVSTDLPEPVADQFIGWNNTADGLVNLADPSIAAAASAAAALVSETNAAASAAAAAVSETNAAGSASASAADVVTTNADVVLTGLDVGYAQEWAITVEDTPVSVAAGGDAATTFSALHWAAKAAASAASVGLPALPAGGDLNLQTNPAGTAYVLAALGTATVVDDFTIKNPLGIIEVNPSLVTAIVVNRMGILALGDLNDTFTDGVADTYPDQTGIDLGSSSNQVFEGGSYRTPAPILSTDTKLLLNATAYNGALAVLDSSTNNHVITSIGNSGLSKNEFKFGNGSFCFDGVNQYLTLADSPDWDIFASAATDSTIDFWVYSNDQSTEYKYLTQKVNNDNRWQFWHSATRGPSMLLRETAVSLTAMQSSAPLKQGVWNHVVFSKDSNVYSIYTNGFQTSYDTNATVASFASLLYVGTEAGASSFLNGYADDIRITDNNAFSAVPIAQPFLHLTLDENIASTLVTDFGTGANNAATVGGNTDTFHADGKVRFGFNFDGATDYVDANSSVASVRTDTTGTVMMWLNPTSLASQPIPFGLGVAATLDARIFIHLLSSGIVRLQIRNSGSVITQLDSTNTISANVWSHIALVQDGVALKIYINSVEETAAVTLGTASHWFNNATSTALDALTIGALETGGGVANHFAGRIDDFRYYQSTVLTQTQIQSIRNAGLQGIYGLGSEITIPTVAHTDSANTLLLLPGDTTTQGNDLIDISTGGAGSPHTVTSVNGVGATGKFDNAYLTFDGTGDYLTIPDNASLDFGTTGFSISAWVRSKADGAIQYYAHKRTGASSAELSFFKDASNQLVLSTDNGSAVTATSTITLADRNWHFVYAVRVGTDLGVYLDTAQVAFATGAAENISSTGLLFIGADVVGANAHSGDMDDYHMTNANPLSATPVVGLTDTITIPTAEQAVLGSTALLINANTQDESAFFNTPSFNNGASITSAQSQFGGLSYAFDGTNDDISFSHHNNWNVFSNNKQDIIIQMWVRHTDHVGTETYMSHTVDANNNWVMEHVDGSGMRFVATVGGSAVVTLPFGGEITDSVFHHVALSVIGSENNSGAVYQMYLDGTQVNYIQDSSIGQFNGLLYLGSNGLGANYFDGNIDGIEIVYSDILGTSASPGIGDSFSVPVVEPSISSTTGTMTLQSVSATALAQPDEIKIYFDLEDIDPTVILNTDIIVSVSRDGGTTFTAATMVASVGVSPRRIIEDTIDVTGQPVGTSVVYKVETFNNTQMRLHSVSELWD